MFYRNEFPKGLRSEFDRDVCRTWKHTRARAKYMRASAKARDYLWRSIN